MNTNSHTSAKSTLMNIFKCEVVSSFLESLKQQSNFLLDPISCICWIICFHYTILLIYNVLKCIWISIWIGYLIEKPIRRNHLKWAGFGRT